MSRNYRHTVQLRNQEHLLFFEKQTITIIEVKKFFEQTSAFAEDRSRLAQWLRAIDTLNREETARHGAFRGTNLRCNGPLQEAGPQVAGRRRERVLIKVLA